MYVKEADDHFDRGLHYFRGGFFPAALQEFHQVQKLAPDYPNIDFILEAARRKRDEVAGSLSAFLDESFSAELHELAQQLQFSASSSLSAEVDGLLQMGDYETALTKLQNAEVIVPESKPLLLLLAHVQRRLGRNDHAEKTLRQARVLFPEEAQVYNNLGNVYLAKNMFREAESAYREALHLAPEDARVINNLGTLKMQRYCLDEAERLFKEALRLAPRALAISRNLAFLQTRMALLEDEVARMRDAFAKHPNYPDVVLALGKALVFRGYFHEARGFLRRALTMNPGLMAANFYLGTIAEAEGDLREAITCYRSMVTAKGKDKLPEILASDNYAREGYLEEALDEVRKLAVLDLDMASSKINLGIRYFEDCQWDEALRHFEEATGLNAAYPDGFYWMGLTAVQMKTKKKAEQHLRKALELNPGYADAHYQLALLLQKRAPKQARLHFQKALDHGLRKGFEMTAKNFLRKNQPAC